MLIRFLFCSLYLGLNYNLYNKVSDNFGIGYITKLQRLFNSILFGMSESLCGKVLHHRYSQSSNPIEGRSFHNSFYLIKWHIQNNPESCQTYGPILQENLSPSPFTNSQQSGHTDRNATKIVWIKKDLSLRILNAALMRVLQRVPKVFVACSRCQKEKWVDVHFWRKKKTLLKQTSVVPSQVSR